ncbi:MAG: ribonuclease HII [bacterium]|nr:ribonuclease HII [bacterium]
MDEIVVGIDEAGRGSCIGPMVIAGIKVNKDKLEDLKKIGIKDSKRLRPEVREDLLNKIIDIVLGYKIVLVLAQEIDQGIITDIEIEKIKMITNELKPDKVIIDKIGGLSRERFLKKLRLLEPNDIEIIYEKKADRDYLVVAASSILAKVERDRAIRDLGYGVSGYPNEKTDEFIRNYLLEHKELPKGIRKRWKNVKELSTQLEFTKLDGFY